MDFWLVSFKYNPLDFNSFSCPLVPIFKEPIWTLRVFYFHHHHPTLRPKKKAQTVPQPLYLLFSHSFPFLFFLFSFLLFLFFILQTIIPMTTATLTTSDATVCAPLPANSPLQLRQSPPSPWPLLIPFSLSLSLSFTPYPRLPHHHPTMSTTITIHGEAHHKWLLSLRRRQHHLSTMTPIPSFVISKV